MTDNEKKAGIDAECLSVIRELIAKKDPLADLAAVLIAGASVRGVWAEAVGIEKITAVTPEPSPPVTPEPPAAAAIEVTLPPPLARRLYTYHTW